MERVHAPCTRCRLLTLGTGPTGVRLYAPAIDCVYKDSESPVFSPSKQPCTLTGTLCVLHRVLGMDTFATINVILFGFTDSSAQDRDDVNASVPTDNETSSANSCSGWCTIA